jgi:hypothetical protein
MREFAPRQARTPSGPCPSAEDLAAYIDRTLDKAESGRITEHLASCEDCYTVYMETLDFQLESSRAEPDGVVDAEVVDFRRPGERQPAEVEQERVHRGGSWRAPARWLPLAALLLIGVGSGGYFHFLAAPPRLVTTPAVPTPSGDQALWLGPTFRGEGGGEEAKLDEASFRMGVQLVNLQATLQAGKVKESQDIIARILGLLKPQPLTDDLYKSYVGITNAVEKRPPAKLLPETARLARESRGAFEPTSLDLGQWVEAGRLAALARNPSFFQQSDNQAFLRRLRWNDKLGLHEVNLDSTTRQSLDRVSEVISKDDLRQSDYADLQHELEKILEHYYPMS